MIKYFIKKIITVFRECLCLTLINKKSVIMITHDLSLSGAPVVLMNAACLLKKRGYNPIILSPHKGNLEYDLQRKNIRFFVLYNMTKNRLYKEILKKSNIVIVNTIVNYETISILEKIENSNKKILWWIHEGDFYLKKYEYHIRKLNISNLKQLKILTVSAYVERKLTEYHLFTSAEKSILPYYIENQNFKFHKRTDDKFNITIVGSICRRKNQIELINAINKIDSQSKNIKLFIVGSSIEFDYYEQMCKILKQVNFEYHIIESIPKYEMVKFYQQINLLVCSSIDDPLPVVVTESMNYKIPVLCSDCTGQFDFIKNGYNGFTYTVGDEIELTNKICKIISLTDYEINQIGEQEKELIINELSEKSFENKILTILEGV